MASNLRDLATKVTPEVLQTITLIEIAERLAAIYDKLDKQRAKGRLYGIPVSANTTGTKVVLLFSATILNDGTADIYILDSDRTIDASDVPLKSGENLNLDMKEQGAYTHWIKTLTGTATIRIFALG